MHYKRPINNTKKYIPRFYDSSPSYQPNSPGIQIHKESNFLGIPLPNEKEAFSDYFPERKKRISPITAIIRYIQKHVKIEELILIGLIVLMLDEAIEDDLLLIILIYILLF
ncbi:MAG: hypothetical protein ACM3XR_02815 [Bacillota bacterium]